MAAKRYAMLTRMTTVQEAGRKGGKNSRKNMSPEERKRLAQNAANARWDRARNAAAAAAKRKSARKS